MKVPQWKRWLSHIIELPLERTSSSHNPFLQVSLKKGRFQLCTANAVYSFGDLYSNFTQAFTKIDLDHMPIKRVLILGFGLGSIPIILEKKFKKNYHFTAVELDEEVLYLANKYVLPDIQSPIEMFSADAYSYVMQCREVFDMVLVDLFIDDKVPIQFEDAAFLQQLAHLLTKKGVLLYNRLAFTKDDVIDARRFYEQHFLQQFPEGGYMEVRGNWMLINRKGILG